MARCPLEIHRTRRVCAWHLEFTGAIEGQATPPADPAPVILAADSWLATQNGYGMRNFGQSGPLSVRQSDPRLRWCRFPSHPLQRSDRKALVPYSPNQLCVSDTFGDGVLDSRSDKISQTMQLSWISRPPAGCSIIQPETKASLDVPESIGRCVSGDNATNGVSPENRADWTRGPRGQVALTPGDSSSRTSHIAP